MLGFYEDTYTGSHVTSIKSAILSGRIYICRYIAPNTSPAVVWNKLLILFSSIQVDVAYVHHLLAFILLPVILNGLLLDNSTYFVEFLNLLTG